MEMAAERGGKMRPASSLASAGSTAGTRSSVEFCQKVGLDYVSCSPYRVPIARLAAAQAAINHEKLRKGRKECSVKKNEKSQDTFHVKRYQKI